MAATTLIPVPEIQQRIHVVRGRRVMLDADLARFYEVTTFNLNQAVSRNLDRFPDDFSFVLIREEAANLIFRSGISKGRQPRRTIQSQIVRNDILHPLKGWEQRNSIKGIIM